MTLSPFATPECPIGRALSQVGDAWTMLILREALKGCRTFAGFEAALGVAPSTLTRRLEQLCVDGLLVRCRYQERPPRDDYELTEKGLELLPVLLALGSWGNRWLAPDGELMVPVDAETGEPLDTVVTNRRTGKPVGRRRVALAAGRGASDQLRRALATPLRLGPGARS